MSTLKLRQTGAARIARGPIVLDDPFVTKNAAFIGDKQKAVVKLDKVSLRELWRKKTRLQVRGGHGDVVFLAYYDEVQAWNPDGDVLWKRQGLQTQPGWRGNRVYVIESGLQALDLQVLDLATGKEVDRFDNCPPGHPHVVDGGILVTHPDRTDPVRWFRFDERRILWERDIVLEIQGRYGDACHRGLIFMPGLPGSIVASSGQHLFGISLADGAFRWPSVAIRAQVPYITPAIKDGRIYAWTTTGGAASTRVTFDLGSDQVIRERSEPAAGENHFVIVDEATGEIVVDRPLGPYGASFERFQEPYRGTLCKNHIVFTTQSGLMAVFRLSDGELVWQHQHRDQLFYPVFEGSRLYVACADGTLVVFEAEGGEL